MSEFKRVKKWMESVRQETTHNPKDPLPEEVIDLRMHLLEEEMLEVKVASDEYGQCCLEDSLTEGVVSDLAKELCDLLVVTHGFLVALGVDGDKAFKIVMDENDGKIAHAITRPDGKIVTLPKIKAQLKQGTAKKLRRLVTKK